MFLPPNPSHVCTEPNQQNIFSVPSSSEKRHTIVSIIAIYCMNL